MSDDRKLLESYCRKSDQSAFNTFYRQQADRLWRFLRARGEQNLLLLRYWIGLTHKEIAINLKLPEGTGQSKITAEIPLFRSC
jgi:DNA-directed RNA polymerase specialized sigma24 family protein